MKVVAHPNPSRRRALQAFTLVEVMVATASVALVFVTLYLGITQGFGVIQLARENLRATQILEERMETIRLYTWDQLNTSGFIPTTFTAPFYAMGDEVSGLSYSGTMEIEDANLSGVDYNDTLKQVTVSVTWQSGATTCNRQMTTLVSRYGLQQYIY